MNTPKRPVHLRLADGLAKGPPPPGNLAIPIFSHDSLVVELYQPAGRDLQKPHQRDEIYFVTRGNGFFFDGVERHAVQAGSFLHVPAGCVHRFEDFSPDFVVWVVFYGPEREGVDGPRVGPDDYEISTERSRLDVGMIHEFLSSSYWARGIPREVVERSIQNSLCFGVFKGGRQAGFARVITDRATFAYLADVFVLSEHRGKGISKWLVREILAHPDLQGLRRILLATLDAHGLYARFGFGPLEHPEHYLTIHHPDVYRQGGGRQGTIPG